MHMSAAAQIKREIAFEYQVAIRVELNAVFGLFNLDLGLPTLRRKIEYREARLVRAKHLSPVEPERLEQSCLRLVPGPRGEPLGDRVTAHFSKVGAELREPEPYRR